MFSKPSLNPADHPALFSFLLWFFSVSFTSETVIKERFCDQKTQDIPSYTFRPALLAKAPRFHR